MVELVYTRDLKSLAERLTGSNPVTGIMRDPKRIDEILSEIKELWYAHPDWRFGQLVMNVMGFGIHHHDIFNIEDDIALERFRRANDSEEY